jgi:exosortase
VTLRARTAWFAAYVALVSLAGAGVLRAIFDWSRSHDSASHVIFMPLLAGVLIYQDRAAIFANVAFAPRRGLTAVAVAVSVATAGFVGLPAAGVQPALAVATLGLAGIWAAGFVLFFGGKAAVTARFPLLLLALTAPIPPIVLNGATGLLQTWSAEAVDALFGLTGTAHHREGFVFTLSSLVIEIASECSGIRSTIALAITALLAGHWSLRTWWAKVMLVGLVLPIAVVKNGVRIVSLSLLAIHVDYGFMTGRLHNDGGVVFFLLALGLLGIALASLRKMEVGLAPDLNVGQAWDAGLEGRVSGGRR